MDRVCTEARGNRLGISIVACLDIRSDDVLHALRRRGWCHRGFLLWTNGLTALHYPSARHETGHRLLVTRSLGRGLVCSGALVSSRFGSGRIGLDTCSAADGQSEWTTAYHTDRAGVNTSESAAKVSPQHRVRFTTEAEAQAAGYRLAGNCR